MIMMVVVSKRSKLLLLSSLFIHFSHNSNNIMIGLVNGWIIPLSFTSRTQRQQQHYYYHIKKSSLLLLQQTANSNNEKQQQQQQDKEQKPPANKRKYFTRKNDNEKKEISSSSKQLSLSQSTSSSNTALLSIAIIGGGIAGLRCSEQLMLSTNSRNFDVTVFDTGRLRSGGRCSTRQPNDKEKIENKKQQQQSILSKYRYDHAAQIISIPSTVVNTNTNNDDRLNDFYKQIDIWEQNNIIQRYPNNSVYEIIHNSKSSSSSIRSYHDPSNILYYGTNGMGTIAQSMKSMSNNVINNDSNDNSNFNNNLDNKNNKKNTITYEQDVWVSPSNGVRYMDDMKKWMVQYDDQSKKRIRQYYDILVIAHNGKCADRLMSTSPVNDIHSKLRVNFASSTASNNQKMTLGSVYSYTFVISKRHDSMLKQLPLSLMFAYIQNSAILRSITCQTRKYPTSNNDIEIYTLLSTFTFASKYKTSQEYISNDILNDVSQLMLCELEDIINQCYSNNTTTNIHDDNDQMITTNKKKNTNIRASNQNNMNSVVGNTMTATISTAVAATNVPNIRKSNIRVLDQKLQLWGAGIPLNILCHPNQTTTTGGNNNNNNNKMIPTGYMYNHTYNVGVCGDWLMESSIAGAWTSGQLLANHIINNHNDTSYGLDSRNSFQKSSQVEKVGIFAGGG